MEPFAIVSILYNDYDGCRDFIKILDDNLCIISCLCRKFIKPNCNGIRYLMYIEIYEIDSQLKGNTTSTECKAYKTDNAIF